MYPPTVSNPPSKRVLVGVVLIIISLFGIGVVTYHYSQSSKPVVRELVPIFAWRGVNETGNWLWIYGAENYTTRLIERNGPIKQDTSYFGGNQFRKESVIQLELAYPSGTPLILETHKSETNTTIINRYLVLLDFSSVTSDNQAYFLFCLSGSDCWYPSSDSDSV